MEQNKLYQALCLCRRAGKLTLGFDAVADCLAKKQAALVLLAQDTSPGTQKRVRALCPPSQPPAVLPLTQDELITLTRKPVGVFCVTDANLAQLCRQSLSATPTNADATNKEE